MCFGATASKSHKYLAEKINKYFFQNMFTLLLYKWLNHVLHDLILSILSYNHQEALRPLEVFSTTLHRGKKKKTLGSLSY